MGCMFRMFPQLDSPRILLLGLRLWLLVPEMISSYCYGWAIRVKLGNLAFLLFGIDGHMEGQIFESYKLDTLR